jgi:hypothetical protein
VSPLSFAIGAKKRFMDWVRNLTSDQKRLQIRADIAANPWIRISHFVHTAANAYDLGNWLTG